MKPKPALPAGFTPHPADRRACRAIQACIAAQEQPATDAQLKAIWPLWNALPSRFSAHERTRILTGRLGAGHSEFNKESQKSQRLRNQDEKELQRLRKRLPKVRLPLCRFTCAKALEAAAEWHKLKNYITASDRPDWRDRIEAALRYDTFDDEAFSGRVALYRVAKELRLLLPGFLEKTEPIVDDIKHLCSRFAAYERARLDGVQLLSSVIFQRSHSKADLPFEKQSFGMPNPPPRLARHLYFARLISLGKCSDEKLNAFMTQDFPKLSRREQAQFCKESKNPRLRRYAYLCLWAWLAENAPVFNIVKARWKHIHACAVNWLPASMTPDQLKVQWLEFESKHWPGQARRITPQAGAPRKGDQCVIPADLLTPLPRFSTVPKP